MYQVQGEATALLSYEVINSISMSGREVMVTLRCVMLDLRTGQQFIRIVTTFGTPDPGGGAPMAIAA